MAVSTGLLVLLLLVTIAYMPIVVPLIVPGATVSVSSIAWPLILTMLLPLLIGLAVDALVPIWTERLLPILDLMATVALVVLVVLTILANLRPLLNVFAAGAILAALLLITRASVIGYLLGIPSCGMRDELGLTTAQRNIAAVMVVGTETTDNPDTVVMVVVTSMVDLAFLFDTARASTRLRNALAADAALRKGTKSPG